MKSKTQHSVARQLGKYSIAAAAISAAAPISADADIISLDLSANPITASGSVETFIDLTGVKAGGTSFSINVATNIYSLANPLAPNSEIMLRGVNGFAGVRGNNDTEVGFVIGSNGFEVANVGAVGVTTADLLGDVQLGMYLDGSGGTFEPDTPGVAYFTFVNEDDGETYEGWLDLETRGVDGNREVALTGIHVEVGAIPEPSGTALLCLGAAGIAAYRRRRTAK